MLIAVDGFEASARSRVGVGRFEVDLLKALYHIDPVNSYRLYIPSPQKADMPQPHIRWRYRLCAFNRLWSQIALPTYLAIDRPRPDVFFAPVHYAPRITLAPVVLGIMDLSFLHFPELFRKRDLYKLVNWTAYSVRKAKKIVAISQSTKDDIIKQYQVPASTIEVVYPGLTLLPMPKNPISSNEVKQKYGISETYLLYVGTLQPRKNLIRLIEAFKSVISKKKMQLVITGKKGWMYEDIFAKVKELGLEKDVIFTGYVPDEELPALYQGAACFVLVSLYEGFGFPVLEAMSLGVPVVCSNVSSLPEIVGDTGVLVNPEDVADITKGIETVLNMSTSELEKLRNKEIERSKMFTWDKAAKQTLSILEEVGNKNKKSNSK